MSFPRYPDYKDSGVEWLGEVPGHWEVWKIAHAFALIGSGTTPRTDNREYYEDGDIPWVNTGDLNDGELDDCEKRITPLAIAQHTSLKTYPAGSVLIAMYGATIGKLAMLRFPATVNQACCVFAGQSEIVSKFMFFWFLGLRQQILSLATGGGQPNISQDILRTLRVACPNPPEQTQIAAFLDRETAKIDELVREQRRLMELLKEKRQAVISHAVTKGLNPHAPMKPSGIEWLGEVPGHWEVVPLKRDLDFLTSGSRGWAENYSDEGELFIRITNLTRGSIGLDLSDIQRVAVPDGAEGSRTKVRPGDVLFSITAYLGSVAVVPDALESAYVSQHVALARLRQSRLLPKWVGFVALSFVGQTWFETKSYGGTKIQLSLDDVRDLPIPVPPLDEQSAIVAMLETQVAQFDTLTAEAQRAIALLQERRTALISAAVTGQIDVRPFVEREAA